LKLTSRLQSIEASKLKGKKPQAYLGSTDASAEIPEIHTRASGDLLRLGGLQKALQNRCRLEIKCCQSSGRQYRYDHFHGIGNQIPYAVSVG
jgi:hypothetical protein